MRRPERTSHEEARVAETLKKGSRVTGAARDKLAADLKKKYDSGASIRALAEETGRSYGFVHRMLSESGVTLRGRGGAARGEKAASGRSRAAPAGVGPDRRAVCRGQVLLRRTRPAGVHARGLRRRAVVHRPRAWQ